MNFSCSAILTDFACDFCYAYSLKRYAYKCIGAHLWTFYAVHMDTARKQSLSCFNAHEIPFIKLAFSPLFLETGFRNDPAKADSNNASAVWVATTEPPHIPLFLYYFTHQFMYITLCRIFLIRYLSSFAEKLFFVCVNTYFALLYCTGYSKSC